MSEVPSSPVSPVSPVSPLSSPALSTSSPASPTPRSPSGAPVPPLPLPASASKQRKRKRAPQRSSSQKKKPKILHPVESLQNPELNFTRLAANLEYLESYIKVPKFAHNYTNPKAIKELSSIIELTAKAAEIRAIKWIVGCIEYYITHHNFHVKPADKKRLVTAAAQPARANITTMLGLYKQYVGDIEERQRYYDWKGEKEETEGQKERFMSAAQKGAGAAGEKKKKYKLQPYNLFVKDQWLKREKEFKTLGARNVISLLSKEWKNDPQIKVHYTEQMNTNCKAEKQATPAGQEEEKEKEKDEMKKNKEAVEGEGEKVVVENEETEKTERKKKTEKKEKQLPLDTSPKQLKSLSTKPPKKKFLLHKIEIPYPNAMPEPLL